jgi:hypothetical protein
MAETERWIFGFKRVGTRELSDRERDEFRRRARSLSIQAYCRALVPVFCGCVGLFSIAIAASPNAWGWVLFVAGWIAFFWTLGWAGKAGRLALLFRRAARVGKVDLYERAERTSEVWTAHRRGAADAEEAPSQPEIYWEADENFEESIGKELGRQPVQIATPLNDEVLILIEDRIVNRVIDVAVLNVVRT